VEDLELTNRLLSFIDTNLLNSEPELKKSGVALKSALKKKLSPEPIDGEMQLKDAPQPILPSVFDGQTFDFIDIEPLEIARQLSIIEFSLFQKIAPKELLNQKWTKVEKETLAPGVISVTRRFNTVSWWIATMIVRINELKPRAAMMKRCIAIAEHCIALNNFNSAVEIISGLESSAVHRLKKTWELIPLETIVQLQNMKSIYSPHKAFKLYRERLHKAVGSCVPYLGIYLSDLVFIEDGNSDLTKDTNLVNFEKRVMISKVIVEIQQFQQLAYKLRPVTALQQALKNLDFLPEKEIYALSLEAEQRQSV